MVSIVNLHRRYEVNEALAKRLILKILRRLKKPASTDIEIAFLTDRAMRKMNRLYKRRDRFTDVLSFRLDTRQFGIRRFLGEILISVDRAAANSRAFGRSLPEELVLYMVHGVLHLFGYTDEKRADRVRMSGTENKILGYLCTKEDLSKVLTRR